MVDDALTNLWVFLNENMKGNHLYTFDGVHYCNLKVTYLSIKVTPYSFQTQIEVSLILIEITTEIPILKSFRAKSKIKTFYLSLFLYLKSFLRHLVEMNIALAKSYSFLQLN